MNPPELFGVPISTWALLVSLLSLCIALFALGWQIVKHFLDGGRVKVYLNTAIWQPEVMVATNRSGRFVIPESPHVHNVTHGRALEMAQLVVENPGKVPITIHSPGIFIKGTGKKRHSIGPRMFATEDSFGPDQAVQETVVRLEPYGRVTFLLDYWSAIPALLKDTPKGAVTLRGYVEVAGRTKRPQKSSWRRRWKITQGMHTAIRGSPDFTPFAVIWRELYVRLPADDADTSDRHPNVGRVATRGMATYLLDEAMARFDERPKRELLAGALDEAAEKHGDAVPMIGLYMYEAYEALDRMQGHLTNWSVGVRRTDRENRDKKQVKTEVTPGVYDDQEDRSGGLPNPRPGPFQV